MPPIIRIIPATALVATCITSACHPPPKNDSPPVPPPAAPDAAAPPQPTPPPTSPPPPGAQPGGCEYETRKGICRLVRHEIADAGDGVFDHVVVRATYEWQGTPPGVVGFREWPSTRALAPSLDAKVASHAEAPCDASILVRGSCPPQTSHVIGVDVSLPH